MPASPPIDALDALYARPGFQLRRAHQVALSVFAEAAGAHDVTTTQYGILVALRARPGADQVGLGGMLGLDRSTTGLVVGLLEQRGLLTRKPHPTDGRRRILSLTRKGQRLLDALAGAAEAARLQLLAPLSAAEAGTLGRLLDKLLRHHDGAVRVPLKRQATCRPAAPRPSARRS